MTNLKEKLEKARNIEDKKERNEILNQLMKEAEGYAEEGNYQEAYVLYKEIGDVYRELYMADECFIATEQATLMLVRMPGTPEIHKEIMSINLTAAKVAEEATEYKKAADFYFRAADFVSSENERSNITILAADALENLADAQELDQDYPAVVSLLKKVGRLYYTAGDDELGKRIYDRASKVALKWAELEKENNNLLESGNALAEAAQIYQMVGDSPEGTRIMMEAGERYEAAGLFEKAGNIYDAAHEAFKLQRLTSSTRQAMSKAAEAYLKMEGSAEIVAPLLVKSGEMFTEIGRPMKAKWAFKKGSGLFAELKNKASEERDVESEKKYLRYQAMCLRKWGDTEKADTLIDSVINYYIERAEEEAGQDDKEAQAVSLEEAAEVLNEVERIKEAKNLLERAVELYVELAKESTEAEQFEDASKFYSKAAEGRMLLGEEDMYIEYHRISSEMAIKAAKFYINLGVKELATIWTRTAGLEVLITKQDELVDLGIALLRKSAKGFEDIKELKDAFEDYYMVFVTLFERNPNDKETIKNLLEKLDTLSKTLQDDSIAGVLSVLKSMERGNFTAALLTLQEREEDLLDKWDLLHRLISNRVPRSGIKVSKRYGIR